MWVVKYGFPNFLFFLRNKSLFKCKVWCGSFLINTVFFLLGQLLSAEKICTGGLTSKTQKAVLSQSNRQSLISLRSGVLIFPNITTVVKSSYCTLEYKNQNPCPDFSWSHQVLEEFWGRSIYFSSFLLPLNLLRLSKENYT